MRGPLRRGLRLATTPLLVLGACTTTSTQAPTSAGSAAPGSTGQTPAAAPATKPADNASLIEAKADAATPSGDPIVIGQTAGLTGFMSLYDLPIQAAMKMAIEDVNKAGGILGRPVELVTTDNGTDVAKIQTAAEAILEKKADFVFTSCDYDIGGPAARTVNAKGVIAFGCAGAAEFGFKGIGALTYNLNSGMKAEGSAIADYVKAKGFSKPYLITDQALQFTQTLGETFAARAKEVGLELAAEDDYQNGDASAASQIAGIRQSQADVIILASYPPGGATLLRQIRTAGINLPVVGGSAFDGVYWLDAVKDPGDFSILVPTSIYGDDYSAARNEFYKRFEQETGKPPASGMYPAFGYSAVQAFSLAAEQAGSLEAAALQKAFDGFTDVKLLLGNTTFTPECHIPTPRLAQVISYQGGKPKVVAYANTDAIPGEQPC